MNATSPPSKYTTAERVFVFTAALILAAIAIGSGSASGQSFDCRSAPAADEVTICHEPGLAKLDQDLAGLRRQRQKADRDDVEDNEIAFLNARHRCGEDRGCIEQSYRNRIQELARFFSEQRHERLGRANEMRAERQPDERDSQHSGLESPRLTINSVSTSRSTNPRSVGEPSPTDSTRGVSGRPPSCDRDGFLEPTVPVETNRNPPKAIAAPPAQHEILSNNSAPTACEVRGQRQGSSRTAQKSKEQQGLETHIRHELRDQVNSGLVTIILGGLDSGDLSDATDLVTTLTGAHLRILPVAGEGAAKDVTDLLFARGIDIAIVQTDVLASLKRQAPFPGIENFLQYISKLYDEEVHIVASRQIHSLEDLASKPVNFGPLDSGTFNTASAIFGALGLGVEITTFPQPLALDKLRRGEIAALVYTAAKPARLFQDIKPEEGLHFLSISAPEALRERYGQATLSAADYPDLIEQGKPISTLSVGTVLAVYNWPAGTERHRNVAHFVDTFFGRLAELRMSRHDPKWREIDIHASVEGWTRFEAASQWIKTAERVPNKPTRIAGPPFPMEGSTTSPVQLSAGSGDIESSIAEPAISGAVASDVNPSPAPQSSIPLAEQSGSAQSIPAFQERGDALLAMRDLAAARLFYERAADAGDGEAALRLGETYDPDFLTRIRFYGVQGSRLMAAHWYQRARELGAGDAEILLKAVASE
jgi:uncharacterized protein/TRAP-type uncharacterized transport system substrate-binding protein